jgi:hypothetical protein
MRWKFWRHTTGKVYELVTFARRPGPASLVIIYKQLQESRGIPAGALWVRDLPEFVTRFEPATCPLPKTPIDPNKPTRLVSKDGS